MKKKTGWTFLVCYLSYTAIYIARMNLSAASPGLKEADLLSAAQIGLLGGAFSLVYALGQLVSGAVSDRIPPWLPVCGGLLAAGAGNLLFSGFPPFAGMLVLWSVNAFAQSMLWGPMLCVLSSLYGPEEARRRSSKISSSVPVGNIAGILLSSFVIERFGLGCAFAVPGAITLILGAAAFPLLRPIHPLAEGRAHGSMLELLKDREIVGLLFPVVVHGVMKENVTLWMVMFFAERYGIDLDQSAYFVLFVPLMGFAGRAVYPLYYRLCGEREHAVTWYAFAVCAVCALPLCFRGSSPAVALVCLAAIYAAVSAANTSFMSIYPIRFAESGNVASACGLLNFLTYLGASAASFLYGVVIDYSGYLPMFLSWAIGSVASLVLMYRYTGGAAKRERKNFHGLS